MKWVAVLAASLAAGAPMALRAQDSITCRHGQCVETISGRAPIGHRLRVNARGPVTLEAGVGRELQYTLTVNVRAANEAEARRLLGGFSVRVVRGGEWSVVTAPGEPLAAKLALRCPRLVEASVVTESGPVQASGVDGPLTVDSVAGPLWVDRIKGDCQLKTLGGEIRAGDIGGALTSTTGFGPITVKSVRGEALLQTMGGDIIAGDAGGRVNAETGAGAIRIARAAAAVDATTGAGQIWVGSAGGLVTAHDMAGLINVGSAAGAHCESASGGVQLGRIAGSIRVSAAMGNIMASLLRAAPDSYLTTGNGDITLLVPSNVGVTIQAEDALADSLRRILSEFPQIQARRIGPRIVAQGQVNGGGPIVRVSSGGGAIFIKRQ
ncbi:MAG TPA: hypothetical protein VMU19_01565 [Bryobacteraceae bacterium]|nr:hypothetical protein [Bryobacteraceae bacterium]